MAFFGIRHIFGIENDTKLPIWHHKIQTSYDTIVWSQLLRNIFQKLLVFYTEIMMKRVVLSGAIHK